MPGAFSRPSGERPSVSCASGVPAMTLPQGFLTGLFRRESKSGPASAQNPAIHQIAGNWSLEHADADCCCSRGEWLAALRAGDVGPCVCPGWLTVTLEAYEQDNGSIHRQMDE